MCHSATLCRGLHRVGARAQTMDKEPSQAFGGDTMLHPRALSRGSTAHPTLAACNDSPKHVNHLFSR